MCPSTAPCRDAAHVSKLSCLCLKVFRSLTMDCRRCQHHQQQAEDLRVLAATVDHGVLLEGLCLSVQYGICSWDLRFAVECCLADFWVRWASRTNRATAGVCYRMPAATSKTMQQLQASRVPAITWKDHPPNGVEDPVTCCWVCRTCSVSISAF